jgi:hypothetical protein
VDLSKLPRLSNSEKPHASAPTQPPVPAQQPAASQPIPQAASYDSAPPRGFSGEAWLTLAVGIILLLMFPRFPQWGSSVVFHTHFNQYVDADGVTIIPYTQVHDFWPDLGCTLFGVVLIIEGLAMGLAKHPLVLWIALALTILATGYNLVYLIVSFSQFGLAVVSALAVAFGIYLIAIHWQLLRGKKWAPDVGKNVQGPG